MNTMIEKSLIKQLLKEDFDDESSWQDLETTTEDVRDVLVEWAKAELENVNLQQDYASSAVAEFFDDDVAEQLNTVDYEDIKQILDDAAEQIADLYTYSSFPDVNESLTEDTNKSKNSFRVEIKHNGKHYDGENFDTQKEMNEWIRDWKKHQYSVKYNWTFQIYTYKNGEQLRSYEWRT